MLATWPAFYLLSQWRIICALVMSFQCGCKIMHTNKHALHTAIVDIWSEEVIFHLVITNIINTTTDTIVPRKSSLFIKFTRIITRNSIKSSGLKLEIVSWSSLILSLNRLGEYIHRNIGKSRVYNDRNVLILYIQCARDGKLCENAYCSVQVWYTHSAEGVSWLSISPLHTMLQNNAYILNKSQLSCKQWREHSKHKQIRV
jgi:hypothetical protein